MSIRVSSSSPAGRTLLCLFPLILIAALPAAGDTLFVPTPAYPTIQSAINAATTGDEVVVDDGTYTGGGNRDMSFLGKAITVRSANGPSACIIDCQASPSDIHRAFTFNSSEGSGSILQGFTIRNGCQQQGGAIYCNSSSAPTITECVFENNTMSSIYSGGAIFALSSVTISACSFTGNQGFTGGGAIDCSGGSPTIIGNTISNNSGGGSGGGIIMVSTIDAVISGNTISGNSATYGGGLLVGDCTNLELSDNIIALNTATIGGGLRIYSSTVDFIGNTITGNTATSTGGGLQCWNTCTLTMANEIYWGNQATSAGPEMYILASGGASTVSISCSDVGGGPASCIVYSPSVLNWGSDMVDVDPLFCDPENGDFQLAENSVCTADHQPVCGQIGARPMGCGPLTVRAGMTCTPLSGTLPFTTQMQAAMTNLCFDDTRRIAARIDINLADGSFIMGWRAGFANIAPSTALLTSWVQSIPALISLVGNSDFTLVAEDVTPAPWNQPPHWPSGDSDSEASTVTGMAP